MQRKEPSEDDPISIRLVLWHKDMPMLIWL